MAFGYKNLTSVTIPNSVTEIGWAAFAGNELTSITIGANVWLGNFEDHDGSLIAAFDGDFATIYNNGGKRAGTYVPRYGRWSRQ